MAPTINSEAMKNRTKQVAPVVIHICRTLPQSLLVDAGVAQREQLGVPLNEANQLVSIFVASLRTAMGSKSEICNRLSRRYNL
jgi:hypothetical protein